MTNSLLNYKRKNQTLWAINISHAHTVCLYKQLLNIKWLKPAALQGSAKPSTSVLSFVRTNPACSSEIIRFLSLLNVHLLDFFSFLFSSPLRISFIHLFLFKITHRERKENEVGMYGERIQRWNYWRFFLFFPGRKHECGEDKKERMRILLSV